MGQGNGNIEKIRKKPRPDQDEFNQKLDRKRDKRKRGQ